eukprot:COSAG01_NODE_88_length_27337_cov_22.941699_5_plen_78_part_00
MVSQSGPDDMWQNWRFEMAPDRTAMNMNIVEEAPWWVRHRLQPPQTIYRLKDVASLGEDGVWRLDRRSEHRPAPKRM